MTLFQIILFVYIFVQMITALAIGTEYGGSIPKEFIVRPYREGVKIGDVLFILFFFPALLLNMLLYNSVPFVLDAICYIIDIRLTKPRPKQ